MASFWGGKVGEGGRGSIGELVRRACHKETGIIMLLRVTQFSRKQPQ